MEKAGNLLGRVAKQLQKPEATIGWLSAAWPSIVGKTLAARTRPVRLRDGYLEIAADGKAWQKQLDALKNEFCQRINQAWGGGLVRQVKFVVEKPGPQKSIRRELDNEHLPFIRKRR